MKTRLLMIMLLLIALLSTLYFGCGGQDPVEVEKAEPGEPPGPPPPPPPPPDGVARSGALQLADTESSVIAMERIARDVLSGKYGSVLQKILADEVSTCLNQMSEEGAIVILSEESDQDVSIQYGENGLIMFDMSYIGGKIARGEFGDDAMLALRRLGGAGQK